MGIARNRMTTSEKVRLVGPAPGGLACLMACVVVLAAGPGWAAGAVPSSSAAAAGTGRPPNIVVFVMDDVGMGDIGCFGNDTIKTPNIDRLAREGAKLTQHIVSPLCTPSRAALMTGRLPVRYGMGAKGQIRVFVYLSAPGGLPSNELTMAELLKSEGYSTALIGKWHLGISCTAENACSDPNSQGFDYFYGLPVTNFRDCGTENTVYSAWAVPRRVPAKMGYSVLATLAFVGLLNRKGVVNKRGVLLSLLVALAANGFMLAYFKAIAFNCVLMENGQIVEHPLSFDHLTERLHSRAVQFAEGHRDRPFLLVMSFVQAHTALFNSDRFRNHSAHGRYGDNLEEMDWSVGEVLAALRRLELESNTLVYLTSDNGGHVEEFTEDGERQGGWNGIYKGGKGNTWEGGIRVPAVLKLPGVIPPGSVVSRPTHITDILPTVASVAGLRLPSDRIYDGTDLLPLLTGVNRSDQAAAAAEAEATTTTTGEFMFHYCGDYINAVRYTPNGGESTYKLHYATSRLVPGPHGVLGCHFSFTCECRGPLVDVHDPPLVYDITADPTETHPMSADRPLYGTVVLKVEEAVRRHRQTIPSQQTFQMSFLHSLPRPWNRPPCGSFPFYSCSDPYLEQLKAIKKLSEI